MFFFSTPANISQLWESYCTLNNTSVPVLHIKCYFSDQVWIAAEITPSPCDCRLWCQKFAFQIKMLNNILNSHQSFHYIFQAPNAIYRNVRVQMIKSLCKLQAVTCWLQLINPKWKRQTSAACPCLRCQVSIFFVFLKCHPQNAWSLYIFSGYLPLVACHLGRCGTAKLCHESCFHNSSCKFHLQIKAVLNPQAAKLTENVNVSIWFRFISKYQKRKRAVEECSVQLGPNSPYMQQV